MTHELSFLQKGGDRVRAECSCGWAQLAVDETAAHELGQEHVALAEKHQHVPGETWRCTCGWEGGNRLGEWGAHYDEVVVNA